MGFKDSLFQFETIKNNFIKLKVIRKKTIFILFDRFVILKLFR
jgi:hypothetical protein